MEHALVPGPSTGIARDASARWSRLVALFLLAAILPWPRLVAVEPPAVSSRDEYRERLKALPAGDAEARVALAEWCDAQHLASECRTLLEQATRLDPGNERAWKLLGYEKVAGKWVSPQRLKELDRRRGALQAQVKAMSDWKSAAEIHTAHFRIRSNASPAAIREIAKALDACCDSLVAIFGVTRPVQAIPVELYATREQYVAASAAAGMAVSEGSLGYFHQGGSGMGIRAYFSGNVDITIKAMFHECTHLMVALACGADVPTWANEGLAVFFESAGWDGEKLDIAAIPFDRLWVLRDQLKAGEISLNTLCALAGPGQYTVQYYPQGWSLIYYLIHYQHGRYLGRFSGFYALLAKHRGKDAFKEAFGVEPDAVRGEWRPYIEALSPETPDELAAAAIDASTWANLPLAGGYAASALEKAPGDWKTQRAAAIVSLRIAQLASDPEAAKPDYAKAAEGFARALELKAKGKGAKGRSISFREQQMLLDEARARIGCDQIQKAQELVDSVLADDEISAAGYAASALVCLASHDLAGAKRQVAVADDMGAGFEAKFAHALICRAENDVASARAFLEGAAKDDAYGFGSVLARKELQCLR